MAAAPAPTPLRILRNLNGYVPTPPPAPVATVSNFSVTVVPA